MDKEQAKELWIRLPEWLYERIVADARREQRSAAGQIRYILTLHYEQQEKQEER